ncbi:preprotein translocase subunit SecE [Candidatus Dojkabacteria bacterium]|nr:preprotein translocase subunit SecE [Candidatus Dojkabacteria bacterium]
MNVQELLQNAGVRIGAWVIGVLLAFNLLLILINVIFRKNKDGIFGIQNAAKEYAKSVLGELKLVEWLGRKDTVRYTVIVVVASIILGGFIALLDYLFFKLRAFII